MGAQTTREWSASLNKDAHLSRAVANRGAQMLRKAGLLGMTWVKLGGTYSENPSSTTIHLWPPGRAPIGNAMSPNQPIVIWPGLACPGPSFGADAQIAAEVNEKNASSGMSSGRTARNH
jgi:hypothetical protein